MIGSVTTGAEYFTVLTQAAAEAHARVEQGYDQTRQIAGLRVRIWSGDRDSNDIHTSALLDRPGDRADGTSQGELAIYGWGAQALGLTLPPPPAPEPSVALRGELPEWDGERYRLAFNPQWRTITAADCHLGIAYVIREDSRSIAGFERAAPLRGPLSWLFPARHRLLIHAAGVANSAGAALLIGRSGAGKSTLALTALVAGWGLLGDDLVAVSTDGSHEAFGIYSAVKTVHGAPAILGSDTHVPEWREPGGKDIHQLAVEYGEQLVDRAPLRAIIHVDRRDEPPGIQPLAPSAAASIIGSTTHSLMPGAGRELIRGLAPLTVEIPAWRLNPGPRPEEALDLVAYAIEGGAHLGGGFGRMQDAETS